MDFDAFDKEMRRFEQSLDRLIPDDVYLVARLDGRGFTRLTKKERDLENSTVPLWQKYGIGIYFADEIRKGFNPKTNTETECVRRILKADYELRVGEEYGEFVRVKMMEE